MYSHKYTSDPELKKRYLKAAANALAFMELKAAGKESVYNDSKSTTMPISGGHEYTFFINNGRWHEWPSRWLPSASRLLPADRLSGNAALAAANDVHQVEGMLGWNFGLNSLEG